MTPNETIENYVGEVIRRLPRRMRNDVGFELRALLEEELQGKAAGRVADETMAMELLNAFGRPEDVAARYHSGGFNLIEPTLSPAFTYFAAAGVAVQWFFSLLHDVREGSTRLGQWWTHDGLGAFWWPGFLLLCFAIGAWARRRWPTLGRWKPSALDRDSVYRPLLALGIAGAAAGAATIAALPWLVARFLPAVAAPAFAYDSSFWRERAIWILPIWVGQFLVMAVVLVEGRWRGATRRAETGLTAAICGLMAWWLASGDIFVARPTDGLVKSVIALILFFGLVDLAMRLYRQRARIAPPNVG